MDTRRSSYCGRGSHQTEGENSGGKLPNLAERKANFYNNITPMSIYEPETSTGDRFDIRLLNNPLAQNAGEHTLDASGKKNATTSTSNTGGGITAGTAQSPSWEKLAQKSKWSPNTGDFPSFASTVCSPRDKTTVGCGSDKEKGKKVIISLDRTFSGHFFSDGGHHSENGFRDKASGSTVIPEEKEAFGIGSRRKGFSIFTLLMILQTCYVLGLIWVEDTLFALHSRRHTVMGIPAAASLVAFMGSVFVWGWSQPNFYVGMDGVLIAVGITAEMYVFAYVDEANVEGMDMKGCGILSLLFAMGCRNLLLLGSPDPLMKRFLPLIIFVITLYLRLKLEVVIWMNVFPILYCASFAPIWPSDDHHSFILFLSTILTAPMMLLDDWKEICHADLLIPVILTTAALALRQLLYTLYLSSDPRMSIRLAPTVLGTVIAIPFAYQGNSLILVFLVGLCVLIHAVSSFVKRTVHEKSVKQGGKAASL